MPGACASHGPLPLSLERGLPVGLGGSDLAGVTRGYNAERHAASSSGKPSPEHAGVFKDLDAGKFPTVCTA